MTDLSKKLKKEAEKLSPDEIEDLISGALHYYDLMQHPEKRKKKIHSVRGENNLYDDLHIEPVPIQVCYTRLARYVAVHGHANQELKTCDKNENPHPYWMHPFYLADQLDPGRLAEKFKIQTAANNEILREKQVCYLHDTIEDTGLSTLHLYRIGFDEAVITDVHDLSKKDGELYLDFIERLSIESLTALKVKIADLRHNSMPERLPYKTDDFGHKYLTRDQLIRQEAYKIGIAYLTFAKSEAMQQLQKRNENIIPLRNFIINSGYLSGLQDEQADLAREALATRLSPENDKPAIQEPFISHEPAA